MKITSDRLAVARAVRDAMAKWIFAKGIRKTALGVCDPEKIIESLPEPPDDSPATLPAPTGLYARAIAEAAILRTTKALGTVWIYPDSTIDAIIASVPAPDVQAQDDPTSASLRTHRNLLGLDDVQAQIDTYKNAYLAAVAECGRLEEMIYAARAEEREACAMVADSHAWRIGTELADQIRARSGARGV